MNDIKTQDRVYRPLVYICSPLSGDETGNIEKARRYCRFAVDRGQIPLAPHLLFPQFMNDTDPEERELAVRMAVVLLGKCQEVWVFGNMETEGMAAELAVAKRRRQPVRYFTEDLEEVEKA